MFKASISSFFQRDLGKQARAAQGKATTKAAKAEDVINKFSEECEKLDEGIVRQLAYYHQYIEHFQEALLQQLRKEANDANKVCSLQETHAMQVREALNFNRKYSQATAKKARTHEENTPPHHTRLLLSHLKCISLLDIHFDQISFYNPILVSPSHIDTHLKMVKGYLANPTPSHFAIHVYGAGRRVMRTLESIPEKPKKELNVSGNSPSSLDYSYGLTIHPHTGHLYIGDSNNHRIQVFTSDLEYVRSIVLVSKDTTAAFKHPRSVAFSLDGKRMVVVDNHSLHFIDMEGNLIWTRGSLNSGPSGFYFAQFVVADRKGFFYISDRCNCVVKKYNEHGDQVAVIQAKEGESLVKGHPCGIMINDKDELMYLCDGGKEVYFLTLEGEFLRKVILSEKMSSGSSNFLTRGPDDGFIVTNMGGNTIYFYSPTGTLLRKMTASVPVGAHFDLRDQLNVVLRVGAIHQY